MFEKTTHYSTRRWVKLAGGGVADLSDISIIKVEIDVLGEYQAVAYIDTGSETIRACLDLGLYGKTAKQVHEAVIKLLGESDEQSEST
jgi:hypothetical protein